MRAKIFILLLFFSTAILAWNSAGHRIIAQIAYDQLNPQTKAQVDALTKVMFYSKYPEARFLKAATWPDQLRGKTEQYTPWHYIDSPLTQNNIKTPPLNAQNVVWAITHAEKIVADKNETPTRRAKYLSFLIHFVGDIHQPLHCVSLYNAQFPQGDQGGNLYLIVSPIGNNLHALWDRGLGLFVSPPHDYQFHYDQVETIAAQWMAKYPPSYFGSRLHAQSPAEWAQEGKQIALSKAYSISIESEPSPQYIQQGQDTVQEQSVLAGDRLAAVLNASFINSPLS